MKQRIYTTLLVAAFGLFGPLLALADVPEFGTVIEGQEVPEVSLGSTRATVEAAYGEPSRCQSGQTVGDAVSCTWILADYIGQGGDVQSQVRTSFRGQDGGSASNDPNDVVAGVSWYGMDGWYTTTGVNTLFALNNQDAVFDLYPNAVVFQQSH